MGYLDRKGDARIREPSADYWNTPLHIGSFPAESGVGRIGGTTDDSITLQHQSLCRGV